ncbi:MAG: sulfotransferase [Cyanophyceae cyanobacterium]
MTNSLSHPLFLVGAERSGTTLLRLMLAYHPQIAWCFEFEYAVDLIGEDGQFPQLADYYEWLETHRIFQSTGFTIAHHLDYTQLVNSFLIQQRERTQKPIIGATVHRHFDQLLQLWPQARFIHLLRDGRDVARSCIGMGWAGNVWTGVERWIEAEHLWKKLQNSLSCEAWLEIKYEELIAEPTATLTQICDFIGVSYSEAMLSYPQSTTYTQPESNLIGQWQRKLSEREVRLVESRIGQMLAERGYELSGLPPLVVTPVIKTQLQLQDWSSRLQFRIQRNGLPLVLSDYLARRLGIKQWQKRLQLKLNAIEAATLK